jgi:hypothetical protein
MLRCIYTLETNKLPTKPRAIEDCRRLLGRSLYKNIKALQNGNVKEFAIDKSKLKLIAAYGLSLRDQARARMISSRASTAFLAA